MRLAIRTPRLNIADPPVRRSGTAIARVPRELPVTEPFFLATWAAVPSATTYRRAAGARPHVHEPVIGRAHHLLVVLDHEHRVAEVAQAVEGGDELLVVALVEPDGRLVEDVEHADELRADLRRQPQPMSFAAESVEATVELEVADADVLEERQTLADLLDDPLADQTLGLGDSSPSRNSIARVTEPRPARGCSCRRR